MEQGRALIQAKPNGLFWPIWQQHKDTLKSNGIFVTKERGAFYVNRYVQVNNIYAGKSKSQKVKSLRKSIKDKLRKYQVPHTEHIKKVLVGNGAYLDTSDTGTGKTYCCAAAVRDLNFNLFVVCPKSVIPVWERVGAYMGFKQGEVTALNYEKLRNGNTPYLNKDLEWQLDHQKTIIVFDECHKAKNYKTKNAKMVIAAKEQGFIVMPMSATVADNPLQLKAIGFAINLFPRLRDFWPWARRHGVGTNYWLQVHKNRTVMEFDGNVKHLEAIRKQIYPKLGGRMSIAELGDQFPPTQISAQSYYLDDHAKVQAVYDEMNAALEELDERAASDAKGEDELPITIMLRARQRIELLKVPLFVELAEEGLENGQSVCIFVNFQQTLEAIAEKIGTKCVVHGGQTGSKGAKARQAAIDGFQKDEERVIVVNVQAGGTGISLHDINGQHPRLSLISPPFSAVDLKQVFGRVHRDGAKSASQQCIVYTAKTVEDRVCKLVSEKLERMDRLNGVSSPQIFTQAMSAAGEFPKDQIKGRRKNVRKIGGVGL